MELLDSEVQHKCRCETCGCSFILLTKDCSMCPAETSFTWQESPTIAQLSSVQCGNCGLPIDTGDEQYDEDWWSE